MEQKKTATKIVLNEVRFSYPKVFTPVAYEGQGVPKYSVVVLIDKSSKQIKQIERAIEAAKVQWTEKWGKIPTVNFKLPLHDGDEEHGPDTDKPDEAYEGMYFIGLNSTNKPQVVNMDGKFLTPEEFYAGCYGKVSINFFPYNKKGKGIGAGLQNICKTKEGDPLSARSNAFDDFGIEKDDLDDNDEI